MSKDDDGEFEAERLAKIAEIRRTGKTWQWPDSVRRRPRQPVTRKYRITLYAAIAVLALAGYILVMFAIQGLPPGRLREAVRSSRHEAGCYTRSCLLPGRDPPDGHR